MRRLLPFVILALLVAGVYIFVVGPGSTGTNRTAANAAPAFAPTQAGGVTTNATAIPSNIDLGKVSSPRALAWNPNTTTLAWYDAKGNSVSVGKASSAKALIIPCGKTASGDKALIYEGGDAAQTVLMPLDSGTALSIGSDVGLSCAIPGLTQFSPDGNRLATIKFDQSVGNQAYTQGTLRVMQISDGTEQFSLPGVASFDIQNDGVVALQFFVNTKNQANSADLIFWDGSKQRNIEQGIALANQDTKKVCQFVTAKVLRVSDKVYTMFGEQCQPGGTTWRLRRTDLNGGAAGTDVQSGPTGGKYAYSADTNNMYLLPGGNQILFSVPNGGTLDLADLGRVSVDKGEVAKVQSGVAVGRFPPQGPNRFLFSPKGDKLVTMTRTGDGSEQLFIYDLSAPDKAPVAIPSAGGHKADRINGAAWTSDGSKVYFVVVGETQALYVYDVSGGQSKIVARGSYQGLAINSDGTQAAATEVVKGATPAELRNNFVLISTSDGSKTNVIEGAKGDQPLVPFFVR
jgi:WD40 repeat protein